MRAKLEAALLAAMAAAVAAPMAWGRDDCALWCANILREAFGYDAAARFRGRYRTRAGAARVLGRPGLAGALRASARRHNWRRIEAGQGRTGDIGIAVLDGIPSTVICRAPDWYVGRNEQGWTAMKSDVVRLAWSIA